MKQIKDLIPATHKVVAVALLLIGLMAIGSAPVFAQRDEQKPETIEAVATGTGTQLGRTFNLRFIIYDYSTMEERKVLADAFQKGQNQGLSNALRKMRAVGRISLTGTVGYDVSYIRMIPTPTGRKIRFVTNRPITIGELYTDSVSQAYNLSGGEFDLNDQDKKKSTGTLFPAAMLSIDKEGQLQIDLNQNAWKLVGILDWKGKPGVN
jgi:hypothetical protein